MRRSFGIPVAMVFLMAALMLGSCGDEGGPAREGTAGTATYASPAAGGGVISSGGWPAWVPSEIPEYSHGEVMVAMREDDGGSLVFHEIRMDGNPYESYRSELLQSGWTIDDESTDEYTKMLTVKREGYALIYTFPADGQGVTILFIAEDTPGVREPSSSGREETGTTVTSGGVTMSDHELPASYPHDFCPVYQPSDLLMVNALDDGDGRLYVIMLLTSDSEEEVVSFYEGVDSHSETYYGTVVLESADGSRSGAVMPMPAEEDHLAQGYSTMVTITLQCE